MLKKMDKCNNVHTVYNIGLIDQNLATSNSAMQVFQGFIGPPENTWMAELQVASFFGQLDWYRDSVFGLNRYGSGSCKESIGKS